LALGQVAVGYSRTGKARRALKRLLPSQRFSSTRISFFLAALLVQPLGLFTLRWLEGNTFLHVARKLAFAAKR
jgi:hypothetical protein